MKKVALFITLLFFTITLSAPKKTTTVKGYYRNSKYIKSHKRTYNISSNTKKRKNTSKTIPDATIFDLIAAIKEIKAQNQHKPKTKKGENLIKIAATDTTGIIDIFYLDVYILRYNDQVIDILPIPQDYHNFTPKYQFHKDKIPTNIAIELVSSYNWRLDKDIISKTYYKSGKQKEPKYLTITKDVLPIVIETEDEPQITFTDTTNATDTFYVDFSILRHNDIVLDILPISRDFPSIFQPTHEFDKNQLSDDTIINLVSNYHWKLNKNKLTKTYYGAYHRNDPDPKPLNRTKETIPLSISLD